MLAIMVVAFAAEGTVDWRKGVIRVTGIGAGKPECMNNQPGIYRAQAKRAAMMDAQRNLAESVKGVQVTSESTMEDMMLQSDVVRTRVDSIIQGMQEVSSKYNEDGTYEVVLEMPLFGAKNSLAEAAFTSFKKKAKVAFPSPTNKMIINQPTVNNTVNNTNDNTANNTVNNTVNNYTGLIVDCGEVGELNPVMSPVIKNSDGQPIYGHENLDYDKIIVKGMASYADEVSDEISRDRAGDNPMIIKAVSLSDINANPVVSVDDADKILTANQHDKFLDNCAVVFVR